MIRSIRRLTRFGQLSLPVETQVYEKHLKRIAESMGKDLLPFLSKEERVRGLTLFDRLRGLTEEEIRSLEKETQEILLRLLNHQDGKQN